MFERIKKFFCRKSKRERREQEQEQQLGQIMGVVENGITELFQALRGGDVGLSQNPSTFSATYGQTLLNILSSMSGETNPPTNTEQVERPVIDTRGEELYTTDECVICMAKSTQVIIIPCNHKITCKSCVGKIDICPMCRGDILSIHED